MKVSLRLSILISGLIWILVGVFLLSFGTSLILKQTNAPSRFSIAQYLFRTIKDPGQIATVLLSFALFLGYIKGRFVMTKAAEKQIKRLRSLPSPIPLSKLYTKSYYFLLAGMMALGFLLRYLPVPLDVRGIIDIAVGMALTSGAVCYFRNAISLKSEQMDSFKP